MRPCLFETKRKRQRNTLETSTIENLGFFDEIDGQRTYILSSSLEDVIVLL